jgi:hypothetical protein
MFGYIKGPKKFEGTKKDIKISQGYNQITDQFFIYMTDKKTKITIRINMDEEFYQQFHNMGNFTFRQTKKDEVEFEDEFEDDDEVNPKSFGMGEFREPLGTGITLDTTDDEMKGFVSVP